MRVPDRPRRATQRLRAIAALLPAPLPLQCDCQISRAKSLSTVVVVVTLPVPILTRPNLQLLSTVVGCAWALFHPDRVLLIPQRRDDGGLPRWGTRKMSSNSRIRSPLVRTSMSDGQGRCLRASCEW